MSYVLSISLFFFFFNDTATTEIYTLSLHDALPIFPRKREPSEFKQSWIPAYAGRSEEHTSELQSRRDLVCRLLLEKKKENNNKAVEAMFSERRAGELDSNKNM